METGHLILGSIFGLLARYSPSWDLVPARELDSHRRSTFHRVLLERQPIAEVGF